MPMRARHPLFFAALWPALVFAALIAMTAPRANAQAHVDIYGGHLNPMPIAVPDFIGADQASAGLGRDVAGVIRSDLERSGLFRSIAPEAFIERVQGVDIPPRFADWAVLSAQALVVGQSTMLPDGRLRIEFRLWDVLAQQEMAAQTFATTPDNWRRIAHRVADQIYERLTGERGYFDSRIVFVAETGPRGRRVKRLMMMDQDGANPSYLTSASEMVLTPRFSPSNLLITYMAFDEGLRARVYLYNLETNRREVIGESGSLTFAPRFSPDGSRVIMTRDLNGNSEIYTMDLRSRASQRLTNHPSIDTSPSYSPDASQIVFTSDRSGGQQLYVMSASGGNPRRISFGQGQYSTPVWSPRGDLVAFTRQLGGRFGIGVMRPDGSEERLLTDSYFDEGPTWSPNGRVIMFFREERPGAGPKLMSIDLTGRALRQVETPTDASDPAWSPLLP